MTRLAAQGAPWPPATTLRPVGPSVSPSPLPAASRCRLAQARAPLRATHQVRSLLFALGAWLARCVRVVRFSGLGAHQSGCMSACRSGPLQRREHAAAQPNGRLHLCAVTAEVLAPAEHDRAERRPRRRRLHPPRPRLGCRPRRRRGRGLVTFGRVVATIPCGRALAAPAQQRSAAHAGQLPAGVSRVRAAVSFGAEGPRPRGRWHWGVPCHCRTACVR